MWNPFTRLTRGNGNGRRSNGASPSDLMERRLGTLEDVADAGTAPILSVSVGTTGLNRAWMYYERMRAMGCADRIQSMLTYDCNKLNIDLLQDKAQHQGVADKIVVPEYLPFSEGFLRQVDQYKEHHGAIERDMETMVSKAEGLALRSGTDPQVILEWIGFGGHAKLSYMLHDIVKIRFPEARILPIICFPDDQTMHQNIRQDSIWPATEEMLGPNVAALLTDNRRGPDFGKLDDSLTTALAAVEACFRYQRAVGSLAEIVSTFIINQSRWISVEHTKIPIPNRNALAQNGNRPAAADPGKARAKQAQKIKARIFDLALPENRYDKSAFLTPGTRESEQRIYVTMPLERHEVEEIKDDIEDQLKREEFRKAFPRTHIAYADGNPHPPNPQNLEYIHIVKFVGLAAEPRPVSLTSILDNEPLPDDPRRLRHYDVKTRGQQIVENGHILGKPATASAAAGDAAPATRSNGNTPSDATSPTPII